MVLAAGAALSGCSTAAGDGETRVVAGIYPYAYLAQRIGGPHVDVVDLTAPGVEPHGLELTPQQTAEVVGADVVVYAHGFQPAVDDAVAQSPADHIVDVSDVVSLAGPPDAPDPHVWLDPAKLVPVVRAISDQLSAATRRHTAAFRANAAAVVRQLQTLDRDFRAGLAQCERTVFVTSHAAFGYLARRYGLRMVAVAGTDPHAEPSPQRQAELVDLIRSSGVTTIFTEHLASPAIAASLAKETGTSVATLDPIEALPTETSNATYFSLMRANLDALRRANGCR
jgi:zinc transport system substrate-binding protein